MHASVSEWLSGVARPPSTRSEPEDRVYSIVRELDEWKRSVQAYSAEGDFKSLARLMHIGENEDKTQAILEVLDSSIDEIRSLAQKLSEKHGSPVSDVS